MNWVECRDSSVSSHTFTAAPQSLNGEQKILFSVLWIDMACSKNTETETEIG